LDVITKGIKSAANNKSNSFGFFFSDNKDNINNKILNNLLDPIIA